MYRRSWRLVALVFLALSVLSRHSTGAPNAQISFTELQTSNKVVTEQNSLLNSSNSKSAEFIQISKSQGQISSFEDKKHKTSYKKYVSPERLLHHRLIRDQRLTSFSEIQIQESPRLSSPQSEIHAHAPPATDMNTFHIGAIQLKGVGNFGGLNSYKCDWGFGLNGICPS